MDQKCHPYGGVLVILTALSLLAGCGPSSQPATESVEERAQARWDYMVARDFQSAYEYYSPGYRETVSLANFSVDMANRPVVWVSAEVAEAECESQDRCNLVAEVTYRVPGGPTGINEMRMTRKIEELWLRLEGEWWLSPEY